MGLFGLPSGTWSDMAALAAVVAAIFAAIQTIAITVALAYGFQQTRQIKAQMRLSQISELRREFQTVNEFLFRDDVQKYSTAIGESRDGIFASVILNTFGGLYDLYDADPKSKDSKAQWDSDYIAIRQTMSHEILWKHWCGDPDKPVEERVAHRLEYPPRFRHVIDCALPRDKVPASVMPKLERC